MILDAIIGLFGSLFSAVAEGASMLFVPLFNLMAVCIEAVVGLFISGFKLGRIQRQKDENKSAASKAGSIATLLVIVGLMGWLVIAPKVLNRKITLIAEDGHSLPFAALIIKTRDGDLHKRTDNAGNFVYPRFSTNSITVKDPRYVEKTWQQSEFEPELIVVRTKLGSSLDSLADKFLKPKSDEEP